MQSSSTSTMLRRSKTEHERLHEADDGFQSDANVVCSQQHDAIFHASVQSKITPFALMHIKLSRCPRGLFHDTSPGMQHVRPAAAVTHHSTCGSKFPGLS
eukprot:363864-Chlamydomonas_euryale.AAC.17